MQTTVRTFRAPDSASALAAVKAALGPEAILLSTRTVEGGLFRRPEVEITAALGGAPEPAISPRVAAAVAPAAYGSAASRAPVRAAVTAPSSAPRESLEATVRDPAPAAAATVAEGRSRPRRAESSSTDEDPLAREVQALRRSVEEARRSLALVTREARAGRELQVPPAAAEVYARLAERGVEPVLAEELVRQAMSLGSGARATGRAGDLGSTVRDLVGERLVPGRAPWLHDKPQVIAVVGPTGVGKTTTLAKIAARALLESRRKVALLTVDTYRIGACDQLARYGEIMGVPVLVARDRAELLSSYERIQQADLVLVDTAGRSTPEDVLQQATLVRALPRVQVQLVVSAATGALELAAVAERYRAVDADRLVFTKLDEAAGPGAVLSAAVRVGRPVSCIADGQRVPEDLHAVTGPALVDLVLPGEASLPGQE